MNNKFISLIELARLDKPIGIFLLLWPSLMGLALASMDSQISLRNLLIVIFGSVVVRSCGCVINDISDFKIDRLVKRTSNRPIANGSINIYEAWIFFVFLGFISLCILFLTNKFTIVLSLFFSFFIVIYPLAKRFMPIPQFMLGITFGSGSLIAYSLESNIFNFSILILYIGIVAWIISFDTYYALEDKEDDIKIGINSSAIFWGKNAITYSKTLHLFFYLCLILVSRINEFSNLFYIGMLLLILVFFHQNRLIQKEKYLEVFKTNNWTGLIAFIFLFIETFL